MVETIDKHGLKHHFLAKDKRAVGQLEASAKYLSEVAGHYRQRLLKYRDKLFIFVDHDRVPWNNNNVENAVKRLVSRRKGMAGTAALSQRGIQEYLVLLSIYQTLRYRQLNFWDFLRSGDTDLAAFMSASR